MTAKTEKSPVAVVMGSASDLPTMEECIAALRDFGIAPVVRILSAHRTPDATAEFAEKARENGVKVIIAAAGMAAHLAGAVAARTPLPVIGMPLATSEGLGGLDALLSTVQMPPGTPVATVAIGKAGARNAAVLAVEILALSDKDLANRLDEFRKAQTAKALHLDAELKY